MTPTKPFSAAATLLGLPLAAVQPASAAARHGSGQRCISTPLIRACVALGVVLYATVACGRSGEVGPPPPTPRTDASHAVADERAIDLRPHPWTRYDVMADNRIRIHYTITGSRECNALGRVEIVESADTVGITLHIGRLPAASCAAKVLKAADMFTDADLAAPLDGRSVRDRSAR